MLEASHHPTSEVQAEVQTKLKHFLFFLLFYCNFQRV